MATALRSKKARSVVVTRDRERESPARLGFADDDRGERGAALDTAVPRLQHGRDIVGPGHHDGRTAHHHHDHAIAGAAAAPMRASSSADNRSDTRSPPSAMGAGSLDAAPSGDEPSPGSGGTDVGWGRPVGANGSIGAPAPSSG